MMLITLTILLPLVHTVAETVCHAESRKTGKTSTLPEQVLKLLQKDGYIIRDHQNTFAVYYVGYPDLSIREKNQFMAACVAGLEKPRDFHNCVNATLIDGVEGGYNITKAEFLDFYRKCNFDANFYKLKEEEDDWDRGKSESEEEFEELEKLAEN